MTKKLLYYSLEYKKLLQIGIINTRIFFSLIRNFLASANNPLIQQSTEPVTERKKIYPLYCDE